MFDAPKADQKDIAREFNAAVSYPGVGHADFDPEHGSFRFKSAMKTDTAAYRAKTSKLDADSFTLEKTGTVMLKDAVVEVALYDVTVTDEDGNTIVMRDRVALAGIGSNSSKKVLKTKFSDYGGDADFVVMQARLVDYVVTHSAFAGAKGPVPATIHREIGAEASITVGFVSKEEAEHLTGTEPNYDGMSLKTKARFPNGLELDSPLAYVSVWGALTRDGKTPLAHAAIPSTTKHTTISTKEAVEMACGITDPGLDPQRFVYENRRDKVKRLARIARLQEQNALPVDVEGIKVFPATISTDPDAAHIRCPSAPGMRKS